MVTLIGRGSIRAPFVRFWGAFCGVSARAAWKPRRSASCSDAFGGFDDLLGGFFQGIRSLFGYFHCALFGINCPQGWADFLVVFVVCFVGIGDGAGILGA